MMQENLMELPPRFSDLGSPDQRSRERPIRFLDISALVKNPMRFEEGYLPSGDKQ
jgi:hypothetical protein